MKDFDNWNKKKILINNYKSYQHPKTGEIWWVSIGINIGTEIFGKGANYVRPVIVINSDRTETFIGIPLTSKIKKKSKYSCVIKSSDGKFHTALIYHIRSFDKRRLISKMYKLDKKEYELLKNYFNNLFII